MILVHCDNECPICGVHAEMQTDDAAPRSAPYWEGYPSRAAKRAALRGFKKGKTFTFEATFYCPRDNVRWAGVLEAGLAK